MGDKYIIELEDKPFHKEDGDFLYRVKGFNSLVFDMTGIGKLTPYTEPDLEQVRKEAYEEGYDKGCNTIQDRAYQRGLSDAWEAARKIDHMSDEDIKNVFGCGFSAVFETIGAFEAIEKIKAYEQKQQIAIGYEVKVFERKPFIVTGFGYGDDAVYCHGFVTENGISTSAKKDECVKTGRYFPEIAEVMQKAKR